MVGGGHRVEAAVALVVDAQRGAEERQHGFARDRGQFLHEGGEVDGGHVPARILPAATVRRRVAAATSRPSISTSLECDTYKVLFSKLKFFASLIGFILKPICGCGSTALQYSHGEIRSASLAFSGQKAHCLRCGSALRCRSPSLGVSSLDLGRLLTQAALFFMRTKGSNPLSRRQIRPLAFCASRCIFLQCGSACATAALLGRFLPRLGPLAIAGGPFSLSGHAAVIRPPPDRAAAPASGCRPAGPPGSRGRQPASQTRRCAR